jgi:biopolymer transport protein ExbD
MPKRSTPEINASSMADIAFLLLIFFLVTTQIASDKGLPMVLPPKKEDNAPQTQVNERNIFLVQINSRNELLVEGDRMELGNIKENAKRFLTNNGQDPEMSDSPQDAVVSIKADRGTEYATYVKVLDQIKAAYHELRADAIGISVEQYLNLDTGKNASDKEMYETGRKAFPMQISEAEPTKIGG